MIRPASVLRAFFLAAAVSLAAPATGLAVTSPGWTAAQQLSGEGVIGGQGGVASTDSGRTAAIWLEQNGDGDRRLNARVREANGVWGATEAISGWSSNLSNEPLLQANGDGSFTLLWFADGEYEVETLEPGETEWSTWNIADSVPDTYGIGGAWITPMSDGSSVLAFVRWNQGSERTVTVLRRASGSATWTVTDSHDDQGINTYFPMVSANEAGDLAVSTRYSDNSDQGFRVRRYTHATDSWSVVTEPVALGSNVRDPIATVASDGTIVATWADGELTMDQSGQPTGTNSIYAAYLSPGTTTWSTPEQITPASGAGVIIPVPTADNSNNVVFTYQLYTDQGGYYLPSPMARTFSATTHTWAAPDELYPFGGAPAPSRNTSGDIGVSFLSSSDGGATLNAGFTVRDNATGTWTSRGLATDTTINVMYGIPHSQIGEDGSALVLYPHGALGSQDTHTSLIVSDASGPRLDAVTVPSSARAGNTVSVSVDPFDLWSDIDTVSWNFGDGSSAAVGGSVDHTFVRPNRRW